MTLALAIASMILGILLGYGWGAQDTKRQWETAWLAREDDFEQWRASIEQWIGKVQAMLLEHGYTLDVKK